MNDLEKHVLRLIQENVDSPDVFTDTEEGIAPIRDSINDALQEMCSVTDVYRKIYHLPLYEGRSFYRMGWEADHFGWVVEAWDRNRQRRLVQTDPYALTQFDYHWLKRSGESDFYMQIGEDVLGVYNKPTSDGIVLELECVVIPRRYTSDTDPIKVREVFQRGAVYLAVSEYYASRGDARRATEFMSKYLDTAGLMTLHPKTAEKNYQFNTFKSSTGNIQIER